MHPGGDWLPSVVHTLWFFTQRLVLLKHPLEDKRFRKLFFGFWSVSLVPVQIPTCVQLFAIPWTAAHQASLYSTISQSLLKLTSVESMMPSNHLILCRPLLLLSSTFPRIRVFPNDSALRIRWPEYWSFRVTISPSSEYSGLISFRTDWFDLLNVQGNFKSLLQHHTLKASILQSPVFFTVQLSHLYKFHWGPGAGGTNPQKTPHNSLRLPLFIYKKHSTQYPRISKCLIPFLPATTAEN